MLFKIKRLRADSKAVAVTESLRSIGARKKYKTSRSELSIRYHQILNAASDPMAVVNQDRIIVHLNNHAEDKFGYCGHEVEGREFTIIVPDGLSKALGVRGEKASKHTGRRKDGRLFPIELTIRQLESADEVLMIVTIHSTAVSHPFEPSEPEDFAR